MTNECSSCGRRFKPVVILDIDGTLCEYHENFVDFACEYWNVQRPMFHYDGSNKLKQHLGLLQQDYDQAKLAYRQGGMKRIMPMNAGAAQMTRNLRNAGAEIWMATTRPYMRHDSTDPDTRFWLDRHNFAYDHLVFGQDKYQQIHSIVGSGRVVAVLDDLPNQATLARSLFGQMKVALIGIPANMNHPEKEGLEFPDLMKFEDWALERTKHWIESYTNESKL